jgi:hypothetical protein
VLQVERAFEDAADAYVRRFINKGIPSLFSDLKALYRYDEPKIHDKMRVVLHLSFCELFQSAV